MRILTILRAYKDWESGHEPDLVTVIERLNSINVAGLKIVPLVVTDKVRDRGFTSSLCGQLGVECLEIEEYSWVNAINAGIKHFAAQGVQSNDKLFVLSAEVVIAAKHLARMVNSFDEGTAGVGTYFEGFEGPSYQHIRNTCALWEFSKVWGLGLFDPICDGLGGMEDFEMSLRASRSGYAIRLANYEDRPQLGVRSNIDQDAKELRELYAMARIAELHIVTRVLAEQVA